MGMKDHFRHSKRVTSTRRWQSVRHAVLERDGWKCVQCGDQRRLEVDHIKPVRSHPELSFNPDNLQALCARCHTRKTRIEIGHKPLSKDRQKWRDSVNALMREGKKPNEHKENTHA
ncbi:HNH endonuclease (plasmid) [Pseudorhodobacter turbinis]|uniref:Putative HNH nuclease YajD n=1 Tax=Pseudorhodobacter turbinis TaxID=2500533 RepID=A0A4P8EII8_9RHOB|nr:HNH endonuclease [Pseudorhodobacter turbinis]QCO56960.1 HNH endonuclease [Pseudorhodobacter turbinis]